MQLLADSGNIWHRSYNCLWMRHSSQGGRRQTPKRRRPGSLPSCRLPADGTSNRKPPDGPPFPLQACGWPSGSQKTFVTVFVITCPQICYSSPPGQSLSAVAAGELCLCSQDHERVLHDPAIAHQHSTG